MSAESFTPPDAAPQDAARVLLDAFDAASARALDDLRVRALDDAYSFAHVVRAMAQQAGRDRLGAVAAAMATLLEADRNTAHSLTAWTVVRSEAVDPTAPDEALQVLAEAAIVRIAIDADASWQRPIDRWPVVSRSVRDALSAVLASPALPSAPDVARVLQQTHRYLGGGLLGQAALPDGGDRRLPVMAWVASAVSLYLDVEVVDATMLLLVLADRDPATRGALRSNGAEHALERELVAAGTPRRRWLPHHDGRRLVTTRTTTAALDRVTLVVGGPDGALVANDAGLAVVWSPATGGLPEDRSEMRLVPPLVGSEADFLGGVLETSPAIVTSRGLFVDRRGTMRLVPVEPAPVLAVVAGQTGDDTTLAVLHADGTVEMHTPFVSTEPQRSSPPLVPPGAAAVALAAASDGGAVVIVVAHDTGITGWWPDDGLVRTVAPDMAAAATRCLAAGSLGGSGVVLAGTPYGADLWAIRTGFHVAALTHTSPIVDCDWADVDGRALIALTDGDGLVQVWDASDLAPVTSAARSITGAATARFATFDDTPCLLVRTIDGSADVRELALATVVDEVPEYRSDDVAAARQLPVGTGDALQRDTEADAIAEVVTSRSVHPPLAIGLFGEWGEGKSYFMERIWKHVRDRSDRARKDPAGPICTNVRQVRFNAWHYAEADLWASLVSELFEQLARSETEEDPPGSISALRAELVRQSKLRERLDEAKRLQRRLDAKLAGQTRNVPIYEQLPLADREALEAVLGEGEAKALYDGFHAAPGTGARLAGRAGAVLQGLWRRPRVLGGFVILLVATTGILVTALLTGAWSWWVGAAAALASTLVAVRAVLDTARSAKRQFDAAWATVRTFALDLGSEQSADVVRRDVVATEVVQLQAEYDRVVAAGQLAGVLEERLRDGTYRSRLGLMSQIHRDFVEMATLLAPAGPAPAVEPAMDGERRPENLPSIDRIALYIDDLDRCPPDRVVEVLEAIHLLLAVPLFVVVVAVDPRWLLRALTAHYRQLLAEPEAVAGDGAELWRTTPIHYLEKIFQVPFTLSPLDRIRYERFVDDLVGPLVVVTSTPPAAPSPATEPSTTTAGVSAVAASTDAANVPLAVIPRMRPAAPSNLPAPPAAEELDPLLLHDDERAFLKLLGPPLVTTPRAVKRLVNSYGLLLALRGRDERTRIIGPTELLDTTVRPHRAALTLLAAVVGAPDASPALFTNLHEARADLRWESFLGRQLEHGGDTSRLARMLVDLTADADANEAPVPPLVGHWHEWVVPCGRLSFQTGRVVVRLRTRSA